MQTISAKCLDNTIKLWYNVPNKNERTVPVMREYLIRDERQHCYNERFSMHGDRSAVLS